MTASRGAAVASAWQKQNQENAKENEEAELRKKMSVQFGGGSWARGRGLRTICTPAGGERGGRLTGEGEREGEQGGGGLSGKRGREEL